MYCMQRSLSFSREQPASSPASKYRLPSNPGTPKSTSTITPKHQHSWSLHRQESLKRKTSTNPTLQPPGSGCGSSSGSAKKNKNKKSLVKPHLPDNWVGMVGTAETLKQYSKDEIKRQEVQYQYTLGCQRMYQGTRVKEIQKRVNEEGLFKLGVA